MRGSKWPQANQEMCLSKNEEAEGGCPGVLTKLRRGELFFGGLFWGWINLSFLWISFEWINLVFNPLMDYFRWINWAQTTSLKFKIWNKKNDLKIRKLWSGTFPMEEHSLEMDRRAFSSIRASLAVLASAFYIFHFHLFVEPPLRFEFSHFERGGARRSAQERVGTSGLFCGELVFETSVFWIIFRWINFAKHKFWIILRVN